jgi:NAD(P)-dependent dehydrogenase (short-subunit alcohol dehydrogenase family)
VFCVICGSIFLAVGQAAYSQFAALVRDRQVAIAGLTHGLAADHSAEGIRVNAVCRGPIFTPFHARRIAAAGETVEQYNARAA